MMRPSIALAFALLAASARADTCPAADKVNTPQENDRGCKGSFLPPSMAGDWIPATEKDYLDQIKTSTATVNAQFGKSYKPQGKSSYVPGQGNGGIRCPKYYRYKPRPNARPVALHRVYDARGYPKATIDGKYWSFNDVPWRAAKDKQEYRRKFAICTDWNNLSKHVGCKLKPGTVVAAGPGESLSKHLDESGRCTSVCSAKINERYPTAANIQVVLHNAQVLCDFVP